MKRVLIIRFSSIGDIVLCSPVLRNLKQQFPQIQIDILTKSNFVSVWKDNPHIHRILKWDDKRDTQAWKSTSYDLILDLHNNLRSFRVKCLRWDVPNMSVSKENLKKMALVLTKMPFFASTPISERYNGLLEKVGIKCDNNGLDFYGLESLPPDFNLSQPYHVIALGGSYETKQVPTKKYVEFLSTEGSEILFVLIGGKGEIESAAAIQMAFPGKTIDLTGKLSLGQSAQLVKECRVLVSGDTGMAHIGAALGKPILWIWGSTTPQLGMMSPKKPNQGELISMEVLGLGCRPCSKLGHHKCPKKHFKCMDHNPGLWRENLEKLSASALG